MTRFLTLVVACIAIVVGCNKKGSDCFADAAISAQLYVNVGNFSTVFPQLPSDHFVNGYINKIGRYDVEDIYVISNEKYEINGILQSDLMTPTYAVGNNILTYTSACEAKDQDQQLSGCECPSGLKSASYEFTVIDTTRLWIKSITYWKQFDGPFGFYPDIYLKINNFNLSSPVTGSYNAAEDGNIVWNLNDTIIISDAHFNLSISAWDHDAVGNDELKINYFINSTDVNNWESGVQNYYNNGGFIFDIERL